MGIARNRGKRKRGMSKKEKGGEKEKGNVGGSNSNEISATGKPYFSRITHEGREGKKDWEKKKKRRQVKEGIPKGFLVSG